MPGRTTLSYRFTLCLLLALHCTCVRAQDARFSQLSATPMLNNPALTGVMNGQLRVTANYQALYTTLSNTEGYRSLAAGAEWRRPVGNHNFAGFGLQLQHDRAGESDYVRSVGILSGSYQQRIAGGIRGNRNAHFLSIGAQVGAGQRGFDLTKLWFSEQYFVDPVTRNAYLDRSAATGEPDRGLGGQLYPDVNVGLSWFATLGDRSGAYFGGAIYHLTRPDVSPLSEYTDLLDRRYVLHGGGELPLGSGRMSLLPSVRLMTQGPSLSGLLGSSIRYTDRAWREVALRLGGWVQVTRLLDDRIGPGAFVAAVHLEMEQLQLGLSYDLSLGPLNQVTNTRGGFEISFIYVQPAEGRNRVTCPTF